MGERHDAAVDHQVQARIVALLAPDVGEVRPDVPPAFVELLLDLLAKKPSERPDDAGEVALRLERILAELIAGGASSTVGGVLDEVASEDRTKLEERQRRALSTPLNAAPSIASGVGSPTKHRHSWRGPLVAAALIVLGSMDGGAWWWWSVEQAPSAPVAMPTHDTSTGPATPTPPADVEAPSSGSTVDIEPAPAEPAPRSGRPRARPRPSRDDRDDDRPSSARVGWEGEGL